MRTGTVAGVEALVRWRHPTAGVLAPARFIPQSESCGRIVEIGRWVLGEACRERARWRDAGLCMGPIAVNVSARELEDSGYEAAVKSALHDAGLAPQLLALEITESALVSPFARVRDTVRGLRERRVGISLDDFGTGYSSLRSLRSFGVDQLKVPIDFICGLGEDPDCDAILEAVLALGHRLGLAIVAEGVESAEQLELLRARGCDLAQGHHLCAPLSSAALESWIEAGGIAAADRGWSKRAAPRADGFEATLHAPSAAGSPPPSRAIGRRRNGERRAIRVVVVDDHDLTRRSIVRVLRQAGDIEVVGEAADGRDALATVHDLEADVVLLDVSMPVMNGLETLRELRATRPELALMVLSMHPEDPYALCFLREGAHGYMTKERAGDELIGALRTLHAGRRYASRALLEQLAVSR